MIFVCYFVSVEFVYFKMGCGSSYLIYPTDIDNSSNSKCSSIYSNTNTIGSSSFPTDDGDKLFLLNILSNPIECKHFSTFAKSLDRYNMVQCWFRLQACMQESGYLSLYVISNVCAECYLAATSLQSMDIIEQIKYLLNSYKVNHTEAEKYSESMTLKLRNVLNSLEAVCLTCLVEDIYQSGYVHVKKITSGNGDDDKYRDRESSSFEAGSKSRDPNDFLFLSVLSIQETSLTFHCVNRNSRHNSRSNTKHDNVGSFALKVTPKASILRKYWRNPDCIVDELSGIYRKINHPYLSPLLHAFQSASFLFVMAPIAACGNLATSLTHQPEGIMNIGRVRFYAAEIVSALCYLHERGLCCFVLKPSSILLNRDGHVMLTDYGAISGMYTV